MATLDETLKTAAGVAPMWETPAGYIGKGSSDYVNREQLSPAIYGNTSSPASQPGAPASTAFDIGTASAKLQASSTANDKLDTARQLSGSLAAYESKTHLDAINAANQKYNIAGLEAVVKQEQQKDSAWLAANPNYQEMTVSPITIRAQQQLEQARSDAAKEAQNSVLTNTEYARISTEGKALIQNAGALAGHQLQKETDAEIRAAAYADLLTPSQQAATTAMMPELAGQPKDIIFKQMQNSPHKDIILNADNPDVLKTFLTDPKHAEKMVGTETFLRNRVGDDEVAKSKITGEIQQFKTFSVDAKAAITRNYPDPVKKAAKLKEFDDLVLEAKNNPAALSDFMRREADTAMKVEVNQKFKDLNTWTPSTLAVLNANPIMSGVLNTVLAKNNGRKEALNFDNIALEMTKLSPTDLAIAKELMIQQAAGESKARSKGSLWPTLGEAEIRKNFSLSATSALLASDEATLASMIGRIWDSSADYMRLGAMGPAVIAAYPGALSGAIMNTPLSDAMSIPANANARAKASAEAVVGKPDYAKLRGSNF